jgi:NADP-dependent 3-hydroxy acid dehydrogenase YdfG
VITGAFGTLGSAIARAAIEAGARVALIDVAAKVPTELSAALAASAVFLPGVDLADTGAAKRAINSANDQLQAMDVLINTAGSFRWQMLEDGDPAVWDMQFNSN